LSEQALGGIKVVNLSRNLAGAFVGQFFADYGAEVVLVEPPGGSPLRREAGWPIWSRGSKSLQARLDDPAVRALALGADVVIDTFRPGVLEGAGLGHDDLARDNPRLVTVSISGFGRSGEHARLKGYEGVVMAKIGAYAQFAAIGVRPGPGFATVPYCTASAAELAIAGALVALYERETSGAGQHVETTLVQAIAAHDTWNWMISFLASKYPDAFTAAPVVNTQRRVPNSWLSYGLLQGLTKDGRWLQFSQASPKLFHAFLVAAGLDDPEWNDAWESEDLDRREAFWDRLLGAVRAKTVAEWQRTFDEHPDVFAEIFRSGSELLHHPQMVHDDQVARVDQPGYGEVASPKPFVVLDRTPGDGGRPVPALDEHGAELRARTAPPNGTAPAAASSAMPLGGVTIIELGGFYAAPFGLTVLTDLGARVIKVEPPEGDTIRFQLPFPELGGVKVTQGKESLAVNAGTPEGRKIIMELLAKADVVLHSFRSGVAKRLGVDEASVRAINPNIIYHEAPGFGVGGPYGHRPAYAPTIGAGSGMARRNVKSAVPEGPDLTLDEVKDGAIRMGAASMTVGHADGFSALGVACGQALALFARKRGLPAQRVLTTMLYTMAQVLSEDMVEYDGRPEALTADAGLHGFSPLYRLYEAADGWVFLAAASEREWRSLKAAMPEAALTDRDAGDLAGKLGQAFKTRPAAEWERRLAEADVACVEVDKGPSHDTLMKPGGLAERLGMVTQVTHPMMGEHLRLTAVIDFSRSATRAGPGVLVGQQSEAVLAELGYTGVAIDALVEKGIVRKG
jgi:crotonobetainyl-CoA:carnitine CoA-transferase CaiB-like acyl-CoA transferase